jgi:hypothetical protein
VLPAMVAVRSWCRSQRRHVHNAKGKAVPHENIPCLDLSAQRVGDRGGKRRVGSVSAKDDSVENFTGGWTRLKKFSAGLAAH